MVGYSAAETLELPGCPWYGRLGLMVTEEVRRRCNRGQYGVGSTYPTRALRNPCTARRGWHGGSLSRPRHAPGTNCRHQNPALSCLAAEQRNFSRRTLAPPLQIGS